MMTDPSGEIDRRPKVSVVVPFFGDSEAARAVVAMLARLELEPGDERIVADNTPDGVFGQIGAGAGITSVPAADERSSYHARNVGAAAASREWILFLDADCRPPADLVERYLAELVDAGVAMLTGPIEAARGQEGLLAEWAATRKILSQEEAARQDPPGAATANLMVRRAAWASAGGFAEGVRSGGDFDFCWRVADQGGRLEFRPAAAVEHIHRTSLRGVVRQMTRYSAGNSWQRRRRPGASPPPRSGRALLRSVGGAAFFALTLRPRRAALKLVDGFAAGAQAGGRHLQNTVTPPLISAPDRLVIATDRFPVISETFVTGEIAALRALGNEVRVEAIERPARPAIGGARGLQARYLEDEGTLARIRALGWVLARHPLRALSDLRLRRRFDPAERLPLSAIAPLARRLAVGGERHVHVHFAALGAVAALRAARFTGARVSIAAHGHEVFATPRALPEKLTAADLVVAPCEYTARHLTDVAPALERVEVVVMGVDGERFRRKAPHPAGRTVLAIGRLVEKKGFADLIEAAALLSPSELERVDIAGDGPLRESLQRQIDGAGIRDRVRLLGAVDAEAVRALLERAALLAAPCVVAADGDRDAMPVVVKEALAMEVPVVATREVGLPEAVRDEWGRLVPPGNPQALAAAIAELLALPVATRAAMGAAGRRFTLERFDQRSQAEKLLRLIGPSA